MSTHYNTEPPPTASILLQTTAGPIPISLFASQTPLTARNFLQHCIDGSYDNTLFHRVAPGFVIQTGDPSGTGEGGENIYEDREFERYDEHWARVMGREAGEKIEFGDEVHSRLKFNRRGLVGMAKSEGPGSGYGSQWFITLGDVRAELDGRCTMFGRVEGDGIYNVVKVAEGEVLDGTERPVYPEKVLSVEVTMWPKGEAWARMKRREKVVRTVEEVPANRSKPAAKKGKKAKAVLSFGDDEDDADAVIKPKKAKFNTALIDAASAHDDIKVNGVGKAEPQPKSKARPQSPQLEQKVPSKRKASDASSRSPLHHRKPSSPDPAMQLPLRNPEQPSHSPTEQSVSRSPSPHRHRQSTSKSRAALEDEISALKASMRRTNQSTTIGEISRKQSALEALIPATSTRGRKRPRPGDSSASGAKDEANALKMLNAFRARLENADAGVSNPKSTARGANADKMNGGATRPPSSVAVAVATSATPTTANNNNNTTNEDEEARLCDLHFIANCASCFAAERAELEEHHAALRDTDDQDNDTGFLSHSLNFAKDVLGKDTEWRKGIRNRRGNVDDDDDGGLVVIDPRAKEREIRGRGKRERHKGGGGGGGREWDR